MTISKSQWLRLEERISTMERCKINKLIKSLEKYIKANGEQNCINNQGNILQFRIDLKHTKPQIWRRVQIPANYTFYDFHIYIQHIFAWDNYHLHEFIKNKDKNGKLLNRLERTFIGMKKDPFGNPTGYADEVLNEKKEVISTWFDIENNEMEYIYDYGASNIHIIKLEKILMIEKEKEQEFPKLIKYKGAIPGTEWEENEDED